MPVYNSALFVNRAVRSILNQSESNFELIVVDDGSIDSSMECLKKICDRRIQILELGENRGISHALNMGIKLARGEFIARMDADDMAHPERLYLQKQFMQKNEDIGVLGTAFRVFGDAWPKVVQPPGDHESIKAAMVFSTPIGHPTAMMRSQIFNKNGFSYDERYNGAEDYELWTRLITRFKFANLPRTLLKYRVHKSQSSQKKKTKQASLTREIRVKYLKTLGASSEVLATDFAEIITVGRPAVAAQNIEKFNRWQKEINLILPSFETQLKTTATQRYLECSDRETRNALAKLAIVKPDLISLSERANRKIKRIFKLFLRVNK